jgi:hypothetical protein
MVIFFLSNSNEKFGGSLPTTTGGAISCGPPAGDTGFAHRQMITVSNRMKRMFTNLKAGFKLLKLFYAKMRKIAKREGVVNIDQSTIKIYALIRQRQA